MSFLAEIRDRTKKGPGNITVKFEDGKSIVVPLRYPKAIHQAELVAHFDGFSENEKGMQAAERNITLNYIVLRACIKTDEKISDDELNTLFRESGGMQGELMTRCMKLMGFGGQETNRTPKGGTRKGR